jgi:hypothetical protein
MKRLGNPAIREWSLPAWRGVGFALCSALLCLSGFSWSQTRPVSDPRWAILVAGISGDPDLQKSYLKEILDLRGVLEGALGFPRDHVIVLFDDPKLDPARIQYASTRENFAKVCRDLAGRAGKDDTVLLFMEGHGDSDAKSYKFNMVGPDPTAGEMAEMLYSVPAGKYLIVNATNCSGGSLDAFAGKGKIVVAATKSGNEKNFTHFGRFFIEALVNNNADVDKNGRVSVFEAFSYAARKVEEYYTKEGSMQSEHPVLRDSGSAEALTLADAGAQPTLLARSTYLDRGALLLVSGDLTPELQALAAESQSLEKQIDLLKAAKDEMSEAEYLKRLEDLLLKLAEVQAKLRKK